MITFQKGDGSSGQRLLTLAKKLEAIAVRMINQAADKKTISTEAPNDAGTMASQTTDTDVLGNFVFFLGQNLNFINIFTIYITSILFYC